MSTSLSISTRWQTLVPRRPVSAERIRTALLNAMFASQHNKQTLDGLLVPNQYDVHVHLYPFHRLAVADLQRRLPQTLHHALTQKNRRLGQQRYRMIDEIKIKILPDATLGTHEIVVNPRFDTAHGKQRLGAQTDTLAYLVAHNGQTLQRWQLAPTLTTLGRDTTCTIQLATPAVQAACLVSKQHAQVDYANNRFRLWDGKPPYLPSKNGTFLDGQPIPLRQPVPLTDGAEIVLASLDPIRPNRQTAGIAVLTFHCTEVNQ